MPLVVAALLPSSRHGVQAKDDAGGGGARAADAAEGGEKSAGHARRASHSRAKSVRCVARAE